MQTNLRNLKFAGGEANILSIPLLEMVDDTLRRSGPISSKMLLLRNCANYGSEG